MVKREVFLALAVVGLVSLSFLPGAACDMGDDDEEDVSQFTGSSSSSSLTTTIQGMLGSDQFLNHAKKYPLRVILDGGAKIALPRADGSFSFYHVTEGVHLLEVDAPNFIFEPIRVEVIEKGTGLKVKCFLHNENLGGRAVPYPLRLAPQGQVKYFEEREKFDPTSYLKHPMVIMGLLVAFMAFVMPKMVENMDPEELAKLKEQQKEGGMSSLLKGMQG